MRTSILNRIYSVGYKLLAEHQRRRQTKKKTSTSFVQTTADCLDYTLITARSDQTKTITSSPRERNIKIMENERWKIVLYLVQMEKLDMETSRLCVCVCVPSECGASSTDRPEVQLCSFVCSLQSGLKSFSICSGQVFDAKQHGKMYTVEGAQMAEAGWIVILRWDGAGKSNLT